MVDASPTEIIKPIETRYKGHRFRSRLEARWAVWFDHLDIEWQYEPEGFMIGKRPYLPDFWLPGMRRWVEVKGVLDQPTLDLLVSAADGVAGLPADPSGRRWDRTCPTGRLLLLGAIPDLSKSAWLHTRFDYSSGELSRVRCSFVNVSKRDGRSTVEDWQIGNSLPLTNDQGEHVDHTDVLPPLHTGVEMDLLSPTNRVRDAYRAARSARFEHGESGAPKSLSPPGSTPAKAPTSGDAHPPRQARPRRSRATKSLARSKPDSFTEGWHRAVDSIRVDHPAVADTLTGVAVAHVSAQTILIHLTSRADIDLINDNLSIIKKALRLTFKTGPWVVRVEPDVLKVLTTSG